MKLKLIHGPQILLLEHPVNRGLDLSEMRTLLEQLEKLGVSWEAVETRTMPDEELSRLHSEVIIPAVYPKYRIRQVIGNKRNSKSLFGKGVLALVVHEPCQHDASHVYPHRAEDGIVTIRAS